MRLDYKVVCLCLSEVTLQELAAVAVPETAYGLLLDLADSLAGETELLAYLLEGHFLSTDTEEVLDDIPLPFGEGGQGALDLLVQGLVYQTAVGVGRVIVDQHVQQAVVLSVHERSVYGNVTAGYAEGVGDLVAGNVENLRQFVGRGHALVVLFELLESLVDLVKGTHLVQRQTDDPGLLGQSLEYRLAYPPHGVGYELEAAGLVELLGGLDKAQVALVDQVGKAQSLILVLFRNRNDEAEIVSFSRAFWSPLRILCANSTSSSTPISSSLPISWRYLSREALSRLVIDFVIFSCLIISIINLFRSNRGCRSDRSPR